MTRNAGFFLAAFFCAATFLTAAYPEDKAAAQPAPYPGPVLKTATGWEGIAGAADNPAHPAFGARTVLGVEGVGADRFVAELGAGYRWIDYGNRQTELPGASVSAGWRFPVGHTLALTPLAGASFEIAVSDAKAKSSIGALFGLRAAIRLSGREYLALTPLVSVPFTGGVPASAGLAIGLRSETSWMVPVREVAPSIGVTPALFSPDGDGIDDEAVIALKCGSPHSVKKWKLEIIGPDGAVFALFSGTGIPPKSIRWNGRATDNSILKEIEPACEYRLAFTTTDALDRSRIAEAALTVDILVIKEGDHYKVRMSDISFPSYAWTVSPKESKALLEANRKTLERIAALFSRFPDYSLRVEGHANAVNWNDPKKFAKEQTEELLPLSQKRAESVKAALMLLGIDGKRIRAIGRGGTAPLADFADQKSAWKNRRVEFILEK